MRDVRDGARHAGVVEGWREEASDLCWRYRGVVKANENEAGQRSSRIPVNKGRVGGDSTSDLSGRSLVDGASRVTPNPRTESGSTRSKLVRVRHLW